MTNNQKLIGYFVRKVYLQQKSDSAYFYVDGGVDISSVAGAVNMTIQDVQTEAETMQTAGLLELTTRSSGTGLKHTAQLLTELQALDDADQQAAEDAAAAAFIPDNRALAKEVKDDITFEGMKWRSLVLILLDEFNILRTRDRDRAVDVAAATNLADLKTRWAARSSLSDRTIAQLKTAFGNKIDAGDAD